MPADPTRRAYFCPTSGDVEHPTDGGFDQCCDTPERHQHVSYVAELIARFGRPMERALICARQRYEALKPHRQRMRKLHTDYRRRSRRG